LDINDILKKIRIHYSDVLWNRLIFNSLKSSNCKKLKFSNIIS
jgi:hypothetical protein